MRLVSFYIALFCLLSIRGYSQSFMRTGNGPSGVVVRSFGDDTGLHCIVVLSDGRYGLQSWNGHFWSEPQVIQLLPKHGMNPEGEFTVTSLLISRSGLFVSGHYVIHASEQNGNVVLQYLNGVWTDVSSMAIQQSRELNKLIEFGDSVYLLGKFSSGDNTNMLLWNGKQWESRGTLLTKNLQSDHIHDAVVWGGKLMVSGEFTKLGHGTTYSLAEYIQNQWVATYLPPYIGSAGLFTRWNDGLILTGDPVSGSDFVKFNNGSGWSTLDKGLEDVRMKSISGISAIGGQILLTGQFVDTGNSNSYHILYYSGGEWFKGNWSMHVEALMCDAYLDRLYLLGDWRYLDLSYAAQFEHQYSVLSGRVYFDSDGNCSETANELPLERVQMELNPGKIPLYTNEEGFYEIAVKPGSYSVKFDRDAIYIPCNAELNLTVGSSERVQVDSVGLGANTSKPEVHAFLLSRDGWEVNSESGSLLKLCVRNRGFVSGTGGILELGLPSGLEVMEFSTEPVLENGKYVWTVGILGKDSSFCVTFRVKALLSQGEMGEISYLYTPFEGGDLDPSNQSGHILFQAAGDSEPIFKQLAEKNIIPDVAALHYHIGVQNTVGREVNRLLIRDTLDSDLYITGIDEYASFVSDLDVDYLPLDNGNYRYILSWHSKSGYVMQDSAGNPEQSKEFVQFRLKLADGYLDGGTRICNQAEIYLGNSEPLYTNEICEVVQGLGFTIPGHKWQVSVHAYPNPVSDQLTLENTSSESLQLRFIDLQGRDVKSGMVLQAREKKVVEVNLSPGLYFLQVNGIAVHRIVVY